MSDTHTQLVAETCINCSGSAVASTFDETKGAASAECQSCGGRGKVFVERTYRKAASNDTPAVQPPFHVSKYKS